jgi:sugar phosphate isomerase/epimerase
MENKIALIDYDADWALKSRQLHPRTIPGYLEREEVIEFFGTLGVQGVELLHGYWEDYSPARLRRLVADAGLVVTAYLSFVDLALPPGEQAKAVDEVARMLDRAADLGAGFLHNVSFVMKETVPLATQRAWIVAGLKQCAERARSAGVTLVCENLDALPWRLITGKPADALDLWQKVASPSFRLMYDCGNTVFAEEDAVAALRTMAPAVDYVHLKNFRALRPAEAAQRLFTKDDGRRYTGTRLDGGEVAVPPVLKELNRMNYRGWLTIEYQGEEDPRVALKHNVEYLRGLLAEMKSP